MNFDDDEIELGYTPSIVGSRSAGMKKITRKAQNKPAPAPAKKKQQQEDFDLLDELLSPAKPKASTNKTINKEPTKFEKDDIDSFFDEPSSIKQKPKPASNNSSWNDWGNSKETSKIETTFTTNESKRPQTSKGIITTQPVDDIIEEMSDTKNTSFKFKRPETAVITTKKEQSKNEQIQFSINPSPSRMMKPPLKRRESKDKLDSSKSGLGLSLPEEQPKTNNIFKGEEKSSLILPDDEKKPSTFVPPLNKRRSSIEMQKSDYTLKINDSVEPSKKKVEPLTSPPFLKKDDQVSLRLDSPKQQKPKNNRNTNLWEVQKSVMVNDQHDKKDDLKIESNKINSSSFSEVEKQMDFMKKNYQKHIDSLQRNLQDQIQQNKQSRDRLMKEVNQMIESERLRLKKIHEEEIDRIKQMSEWEKKKMQENYKSQIESLRGQLERANSLPPHSHSTGFSSVEMDKKEIQYLEQKLKSERRSLEDREKILDRRELSLQESEREFTRRKRMEEQRLRDEEKRIFHIEMENKKNLLHQKKILEEEKQAIATELASLELGNFKKVEIAENMANDLEVQKRELENEKREIRNLYNQNMQQVKKKQEQLKREKENNSRLQAELINKLRVVEAKAAKDKINMTEYAPKAKVNQTINYKQNTWVQENAEHSIRPMSAQKVSQHKKMEQTQNRFLNITQTLKDSMKLSQSQKNGFDINQYLMNMSKYTRTKHQY